MNSIHKVATLVIALTITLAGATLATAPLALTGSQSLALQHRSAVTQVVACHKCALLLG